MKPLALILAAAACLSLCACTKSPVPPTTQAPPVADGMKTVYVRTSVTKTSANQVNRSDFLYDEQTDLLQEVIYYSGTAQSNRMWVECDENGNPMAMHSSDGEMMVRYTYDEKGRQVSTSQYHGEELINTTTNTFDGDRLISIVAATPALSMTEKITYIYNEQGLRVREDQYRNDEMVRYGFYTYDGKTLKEISYYLPDGTEEYVIKIDDAGQIQTRTNMRPDGTVIQKTVYTYDEHGNLLATVVYDAQNQEIWSEVQTWKAIRVRIDCPRASF